jgi:hypothetical protein
MIVQYADLCWSPWAAKAAIRKKLERRGTISRNPVDRTIVWNIYEVTGDKIAVATLVGQRKRPALSNGFGCSRRLGDRPVALPRAEFRGHERLGGTTTQGSCRWLRRAQALDAAPADKLARRAR